MNRRYAYNTKQCAIIKWDLCATTVRSLIITARIRRTGKVMFSVCPHLGGVPISHNALQHFPECHGAATGGGGVPCQVQPGGGVTWWGGTLPGPAGGGGVGYPAGGVPCQVQPGGVPWWGDTQVRYPPQPGQLGGYPGGGVPCQVQLGGGWGYPGRGGTLPGPARGGTLAGGHPGQVPPMTRSAGGGGTLAGGYPGQVPPLARSAGGGVPWGGGVPRSGRTFTQEDFLI